MTKRAPTSRQMVFAAALGSTLLLGGAFVFQALGYAPCKMCFWQRYPHAIAIAIGAIALLLPRGRKPLALLGALAAAATSGIGFFHAGVEQKWWDGPSSCTGGGLEGVTDLLNTNIAPIVMCDEIAWSIMGLSMAALNGIISLVLAGIWIAAARKS